MGMLNFPPRLIQCKQAAHAEQHNRDNERVDVALTSVAKGVFGARGTLGTLTADQQEELVAGVGNGVDGLGQHG
ncbi:hypothetical protein D9M72_563990 [compost metagenome]